MCLLLTDVHGLQVLPRHTTWSPVPTRSVHADTWHVWATPPPGWTTRCEWGMTAREALWSVPLQGYGPINHTHPTQDVPTIVGVCVSYVQQKVAILCRRRWEWIQDILSCIWKNYSFDSICYNFVLTEKLYYAHIHLRLISFIARKPSMIWGWNFYQSTSLTESQKAKKNSRLQILGNQLVNHSPSVRYTNHNYYLQYYYMKYVNESWVNVCIV